MANTQEQKGKVAETAAEAIEVLSQLCANIDNAAMGLSTPIFVGNFMKEVERLKNLAMSGLKEDQQPSDLKSV